VVKEDSYRCDEAELSNGQLGLRVRAYDRELTWAPPDVANELLGTQRAARRSRESAAQLAADATNAAQLHARLARDSRACHAPQTGVTLKPD